MSTKVTGGLAKLVIEAFSDSKCTGAAGRRFEVMFNPASYTTHHAVEYDEVDQAHGTSGMPQRYKLTKPTDFTLAFTLDGTGASGPWVDVDARIHAFLATVHTYDGSVHRPPYLKLIWGAFLMRCVFKSADIKSSLFRPDGSTLRAEITATFSGFVDDARRIAQDRTNSPDLTYRHRVIEGETLPQLCARHYGHLGPLVHVARFNGIADLMTLDPGSTVYFPPLVGGRR